MTTDHNKKIIESLYNDAINRKNLPVIDLVISPDFVSHGIPNAKTGPEGFKEMIKRFSDAFPDRNITIENMIAEGDVVATRGYWTGTNKGEFMGLPASGKKVKVEYADFWKISEGMCIENWVQMDLAGLMVQEGAMSEPIDMEEETEEEEVEVEVEEEEDFLR